MLGIKSERKGSVGETMLLWGSGRLVGVGEWKAGSCGGVEGWGGIRETPRKED